MIWYGAVIRLYAAYGRSGSGSHAIKCKNCLSKLTDRWGVSTLALCFKNLYKSCTFVKKRESCTLSKQQWGELVLNHHRCSWVKGIATWASCWQTLQLTSRPWLAVLKPQAPSPVNISNAKLLCRDYNRTEHARNMLQWLYCRWSVQEHSDAFRRVWYLQKIYEPFGQVSGRWTLNWTNVQFKFSVHWVFIWHLNGLKT